MTRLSGPLSRLLLLFAAVASLAGCSSAPAPSLSSEGKPLAERVRFMESLIGRSGKLPGKVVDAHYLELRIGDGRLGPADYESFKRIEIDPTEAARWKEALKAGAKDYVAKYRAAPAEITWWLDQEQFREGMAFPTWPLFGRRHGWVLLSKDENYLYVYTFTT
jgi:hypothetical protein